MDWQNLIMQRIVIIGSTGSGKSTLARAISEKLGIRQVELDDLHWAPGWVEIPDAQFRKLADAATAGEKWVVSGNYSPVRDIVWGRATTIVWLNYAFLPTAYRLIGRTIRRSSTGEPCCNGNRETWARQFGRDSILLWLVKSWAKNRRSFPLALSQYSEGRTIVIHRTSKEARAWFERLS
jgi:adenylate kinase family enzyme